MKAVVRKGWMEEHRRGVLDEMLVLLWDDLLLLLTFGGPEHSTELFLDSAAVGASSGTTSSVDVGELRLPDTVGSVGDTVVRKFMTESGKDKGSWKRFV
ncbi:MAG: hypothetical protein Q9199_007037 [Rusavskia elegans]